MAFQTIIGPSSGTGSGIFPTLVFVQGNEQRVINLDHSPFSVGRKVDKDLVIADPRVSRDHAQIVSENGSLQRRRPGQQARDVRQRRARRAQELWSATTVWNSGFAKSLT